MFLSPLTGVKQVGRKIKQVFCGGVGQCGLEEAPVGSSVIGSQAVRLALGTGLEFLARINSRVSIIIDRFVKIDPHYTKNLESYFASAVCRLSLKK